MSQKWVDASVSGRAVIDALEPRQMLSVTLDGDGVVHVEGTRRNDAVAVVASTSKGRPTIRVALNGREFVFRAGAVRRVTIVTGKGDDEIVSGLPASSSRPHDHLDQTTVPMTVLAGAGDDVVTGSNAGDVLEGQAGDDLIYGYGGNDVIRCGDGNDTVLGGGGADTIAGGAGDDDLAGDVEYINQFPELHEIGTPIPVREPDDAADVITGGRGVDTFHNGDARAQQKDAGREDRTVEDPIVY
jgi:Ca2+-binding RTX toxin-like protein